MYDYCIHSDSSQATALLSHFFPLLQPDKDSMQDSYLTLFYQFFQVFEFCFFLKKLKS